MLDLQPHGFDHSKKQVFGPDEAMLEALGFQAREHQRLLDTRRELIGILDRFGTRLAA